MCLMDHKLSGLKPVSFDHFIQNSFLEVHMHKLVRHPPHVESFEGYTKQSSEDSSSIFTFGKRTTSPIWEVADLDDTPKF